MWTNSVALQYQDVCMLKESIGLLCTGKVKVSYPGYLAKLWRLKYVERTHRSSRSFVCMRMKTSSFLFRRSISIDYTEL